MTATNQENYTQTIYYVYVLIDPRNKQPFYVGKGKGDRVHKHYRNFPSTDKTNPQKANKIKKLQRMGYKPKYEIIFETTNEAEAYEKEAILILKWGRKGIDEGGILTNITARGKVGISKYSRPVDQYDLLGNFIRTFPSCTVAAEFCKGKCKGASISSRCKQKSRCKSAYGFYWTYKGEPLNLKWCADKKKKPTYQWTLEGDFVCMYESINAAAKSLGWKSQNIQEAISLKTTTKGFQWTFENSSPGKYAPRKRSIVYQTIYQWSLDGKLIEQHPSVFHAANSLKISGCASNIRRRLKTKGVGYGFKWSYDNKFPLS